MTQSISQVSLYEQDFALWIDDTVAKLKAGKLEQLDIENLIEEIESLGRSEKRELESRLVVLISHILKRVYVNSPNDYRGWINTIEEQRTQLELLFRNSPSLKNNFECVFPELYQFSLKRLRREYSTNFPDEWQFSNQLDALLNDTFWEEEQ
ncbi:DUF29 domain-containing protein [Pseudanabaenaceae cyanobacterium LEGE 13415]|nr:DUF29 domain-containing protein [Pseudanabaenaceae cyanobacterium LEGE 13415]